MEIIMTENRKTWFITGISRGFGKSLAEKALLQGDIVIGTVRSGKPDIAPSPDLHVLTLDVADAAALPAAIDAAFAVTGRIDVLVNNAGYGLLGPLEHATDEQIEHLFAVDIFAPIHLIRAALPGLRRQGSGHIINITSIAGRAPGAGSALYATVKHALEGLSHALEPELKPLGIAVTAVAPGAFRTDFLDPHSIRKSTGEADDYAAVTAALARLDGMAGKQIGDPDRASDAILQLAATANPPTHLLLGSDALTRHRARLKAEIDEIDAWESVTSGTDYPG
jgi:NAD(P)-dependent dehydrogenase (short-subunit alcohol dehydrogenase family)